MAPGSIVQSSFGGGIFRGRRAPADSVYDAVNALVSDERELFRRGGSSYKSGSNVGTTPVGLWDGYTGAGQRTVFWGVTDAFYVLDSNDSSPVTVYSSFLTLPAGARGAGVQDTLALPAAIGGVYSNLFYGGSRKTADYQTGTMTVTAGSATVTGSGTTWTGNVDAGMVLVVAGQTDRFAVVASVESNTSLTLTAPWAGSTASTTYTLKRLHLIGTAALFYYGANDPAEIFQTVAGGRLLLCAKQRAFFSPPDMPASFAADDYHEIPAAGKITGASSLGDTAILFTTGGVWAISNLALDAFDDVGNIQHQVQQVSQDVILWGDPGIAAYEGALIVPAIDDVYAVTLSAAPVPLSQGVRPLYREYVEAGYKPGTATVYRGHYFLPILNASNNVIDSLVCRLDLRDTGGSRRPAWTRQANGAAGRAYATRVGATARTPKLLGLDGLRVSDLTGCFDPDSTRKDDADGTDHALTVTSNDLDTGPGLRGNTVLSANAEYELVDAASDNPTVAFATAAGAEGSSFTTHTALATGASTGPESDGTVPVAFDVRRKVERVRWRFQTAGAAASAILRRVELKVRPSGRQ